MYRFRFAPSPTGYLHIGNIRIALINWLLSLKKNCHFFLRYDDTDSTRSTSKYVKEIYKDLLWIGIKPNIIFFQSKRYNRYYQILNKLKKYGLLYDCYETIDELKSIRKDCIIKKIPPIYDRRSLMLTKKDKEKLEKSGRIPYWRFLLPNYDNNNPFIKKRSYIYWNDLVYGKQKVDLASLSDPIILRTNNNFLYTFSSVVDDIDSKITHIIRGDDHITNTGIQIALFKSLKRNIPIFAHINRLTMSSGENLSKRRGSLSIRNLRKSGFDRMSIASLSVFIGTSKNIKLYKNMEELRNNFDIKYITRSAAKFNINDLMKLNKSIILSYNISDILQKLYSMGIDKFKAKDFWMTIKDNIYTIKDIKHWWNIINNENLYFKYDNNIEVRKVLENAITYFPLDAELQVDIFKNWILNIKKHSNNITNKQLLGILRFAITGCAYGPSLEKIILLMNGNIIIKRLKNSINL